MSESEAWLTVKRGEIAFKALVITILEELAVGLAINPLTFGGVEAEWIEPVRGLLKRVYAHLATGARAMVP